MSMRLRLRVSLLLYMLGDMLGMLAVGHPTAFGMGTFTGCALVYLGVLVLSSVKRGSQ